MTKLVRGERGSLPVTLAAQVAARHLEEAIGTVISDGFFRYASWTSYLLTVFAVEEVFERV